MKTLLRIKKPDDSNQYFPSVEIRSEYLNTRDVQSISFSRNKKDAVHGGLVQYWRGLFPRRQSSGSLYFPKDKQGIILLYIEKLPIAIQHMNGRYRLNGKHESLSTICNALARVTFKAIRVKESVPLMVTLNNALQLPEDVKYCLENRVPYHFYNGFTKVDVRLNVQQISEKMLAIEVSDGVWGEISINDLKSFCTFFYHNKQMGKFKYMGTKRLYEYVMGTKPSESQFELMKEFLKQNRQQDIVEDRAMQLLKELNEQYDRLHLVYNEKGEASELYVKGNDYDWKITDNKFKSEIQMVSTFVLQPASENNSEGIWLWKGPICIDNMSAGSSLGDQFAARALALLNDTTTIKIVNTIKRYLTTPPNKNRIDFDEMQRM